MSSWITPVTNWTTGRIPTDADLNRIEGNTEYLKDESDDHESRITVIEGSGAAQGVGTGNSPEFADATIAGHAINSELNTLNSRVNQGVKTTDSPVFNSLKVTALSAIWSAPTRNDVFNYFAGYLSNGEFCQVSGSFQYSSGAAPVSYAYRNLSNQVTVYGMDLSGLRTSKTFTAGDASSALNISFCLGPKL